MFTTTTLPARFIKPMGGWLMVDETRTPLSRGYIEISISSWHQIRLDVQEPSAFQNADEISRVLAEVIGRLDFYFYVQTAHKLCVLEGDLGSIRDTIVLEISIELRCYPGSCDINNYNHRRTRYNSDMVRHFRFRCVIIIRFFFLKNYGHAICRDNKKED